MYRIFIWINSLDPTSLECVETQESVFSVLENLPDLTCCRIYKDEISLGWFTKTDLPINPLK
jgi:hypothetical protein